MESLYFYAAPWKKSVLNDLMTEFRKTPVSGDPERIAVNGGFRMGPSFQWARMTSKQRRYLSTVVMDHKEKRRIVQDIHEYLHPDTRRWYQSRGLPYRRGYLFHGPPGTGKSSLCQAIASMVYLDIYIVSLGAVGLDENNLAVLFRLLPERCIVLVEDVDEAGIQKRRPNSTPAPEVVDLNEKPSHNRADSIPQGAGGITLSAFLNAIDGVGAQEGRILIMSTNHIERLDSALLRPGRVDMKIYMGPVHRQEAREIFLMFYLQPTDTLFMNATDAAGTMQPLPAKPDWELEHIVDLSTVFTDKIPSGQFTAAELQTYLLQYKDDPSAAARNVAGWLFDLDSETDLSAFRIAEPPCRFRFHGTTYRIRVSAHVFSWPDNNNSLKPRLLLIQRTLCDTKPEYWEVPGGEVEEQDQSLRNALGREVQEKTGLLLSQITHALPVQTWRRFKEGEWHEWVGLPYIIEVSRRCATSQGVPQPVIEWEDAIQLNPEENQGFTWATEDEVRSDKYQIFGNHKEAILEAFATVTQNRSV